MLEVDELDTLADLAHEDGASSFRQDEIVVDHPLKEFASFDAFVAILEKCKINKKKKTNKSAGQLLAALKSLT